jgi:peptidoglycan/xylan/chitin deacetylase (PgdA/CDA1 family)
VTRAAARTLAYRSGMLGLRHRRLNRDTLTVAMFHRVIAPGTPEAAQADLIYSLPADLFAASLEFFRRHYAVVGLDEVRASQAGTAALPPRALLLTFDDGWHDTLSVALPLLRRAGLPAVVFVATDALADPASWWWQEMLLRAFRTGEIAAADMGEGVMGGDVPPALALLLQYAALDPAARAHALTSFMGAPFMGAAGMRRGAIEGRHMLQAGQLGELAAGGIAIGGHGAAHLPLSLLADPGTDLRRCRAALGTAVTALSFPHGRYDAASIAAARATGFATLFTSDACLNATPDGRAGDLLGRISIQTDAIAGRDGAFDPARLATWLFHRKVRRLAA